MPLSSVSLIGSAAKKTIIRPFDDIDVLAVFSNSKNAYSKYKGNSQDFLYRIRQACNSALTQQVGARGQAVRIFFNGGGHVDVAAVFYSTGDNYVLPAGDGTWIYTSPFKANSWFVDRNVQLGKNLRPLIRLVKQWNRAHSSRLKSFHLETVAANTFAKLGANQRSNLENFFEWASKYMYVADPGGHNADLSGYLTWQARQDVITSFSAAKNRCTKALEAERNGEHAEAKRLWRIVLGDEFPA